MTYSYQIWNYHLQTIKRILPTIPNTWIWQLRWNISELISQIIRQLISFASRFMNKDRQQSHICGVTGNMTLHLRKQQISWEKLYTASPCCVKLFPGRHEQTSTAPDKAPKADQSKECTTSQLDEPMSSFEFLQGVWKSNLASSLQSLLPCGQGLEAEL